MLFAVKNRLGPTLLLLIVLVSGSLVLRAALGLRWRLEFAPELPRQLALGLAGILISDGLIHGALSLRLGDRYRARYQALADAFRPQGPAEIIASGLLAGGGEELLFRGVLLNGLLARADLSPAAAVGLSALLFGAMHWQRDSRLALFAVWAAGQGVILGCLYVATGSLLVPMLVHGTHDLLGFSLFAWQRAAGEHRGPRRTEQHQ